MMHELSVLSTLAATTLAADFPQAEISNGSVRAKLYLPDARQGYYRATRFDWSGQIASLEFQGHNYFGQWFDRYDANLHDSILGPVEEFLANGLGPGYNDVKTGESFVKIGVGAVRKQEERAFRQFDTYEITDPGRRTVNQFPDRVDFIQELRDTAGCAYLYKKTVRLTKCKPQLALEHSLKNTGSKPIETSVYEHNFYVIDGKPAARFHRQVPLRRTRHGRFEGDGRSPRATSSLTLTSYGKARWCIPRSKGHGNTAKDYDIRVENAAAHVGVRQTSDRPLTKPVFWSIRTTICPEAYIDMRIVPAKEFTWRISCDSYDSYDFCTLP